MYVSFVFMYIMLEPAMCVQDFQSNNDSEIVLLFQPIILCLCVHKYMPCTFSTRLYLITWITKLFLMLEIDPIHLN